MALVASTTVPEVELKMDNNVPHAIKLVMAMSSASPELTVGEHNKKLMISRSMLWILAVYRPSVFILFSAGTVYATRGWDYQWCLPVALLSFIYQAAVMFALGHLALFVPRTPFAVCEALDEVGFKEIGLGVLVSSAIVVTSMKQKQMWLFKNMMILTQQPSFRRLKCLVQWRSNPVVRIPRSQGLITNILIITPQWRLNPDVRIPRSQGRVRADHHPLSVRSTPSVALLGAAGLYWTGGCQLTRTED